jgi:hypothetical protein
MADSKTVVASLWTDWAFWSMAVSVLAIVLTQLPPLRQMFRKGRLKVDVYSQMFLHHKYGNPNAQLHLILSNRGGRTVRVKNLTMDFKNRSGGTFSLPAANYLEKQGDQFGALFVPFNIKASEEWSHIVNFYPPISRQDDISAREATATLRHDLHMKRLAEQDPSRLVEGDEINVKPFKDLFLKQFRWLADEYELNLHAETEPPNALESQRLRVVIFEADTKVLVDATAEYKYGHGILPNTPVSEGVAVMVSAA